MANKHKKRCSTSLITAAGSMDGHGVCHTRSDTHHLDAGGMPEGGWCGVRGWGPTCRVLRVHGRGVGRDQHCTVLRLLALPELHHR